MDNIINLLKKHPIRWVLLAFFAPLVVVHILYYISAPHPSLTAQWGAGDVITYCAGFMAFIGTIFLGIIAIDQNNKLCEQNDKLHDQNDKLMKMQEDDSIRIRSCNVYLHNETHVALGEETLLLENEIQAPYSPSTAEGAERFYGMSIHNTSSAFLSKIRIYSSSFEFLYHITLTQSAYKHIKVPMPAAPDNYNVEFTSCYGVTTYGDFVVDTGFDEETDWTSDTTISTIPYIKHYHFYGTTPPG